VGCGGCEANLAGLSNIELLPAFAQEAPACSLDGSSQVERAREFRALFAWLQSAEREGAGFRWIFQNGPGVERRVRELARREHECCPFLAFAISTRGDEVVWQGTGFVAGIADPGGLRTAPAGHELGFAQRNVEPAVQGITAAAPWAIAGGAFRVRSGESLPATNAILTI
jgi:hypothetical protein